MPAAPKAHDQGTSAAVKRSGTSYAGACPSRVLRTAGDPPDNYKLFLKKLMDAAADGQTPLKGLQHAVLGYGSSYYPTFQNCPRLSDKYLGLCGARAC